MSKKQNYSTISRGSLAAEFLLDGDANDTSWNWNNGTASNVTWVASEKWYVAERGSFNWTSSKITTWSNLWITSFPVTLTSTVKYNWSRFDFLDWSTATSYYWIIAWLLADWSIFVTYWDGTWSGSSDRKSFKSATGIFTSWNTYCIQIVCTDFNNVTMYVNWTQHSVPFSSWTATSINFTWATYSIWFVDLGSVYGSWECWLVRAYTKSLSDEERQALNVECNRRLWDRPSYPALLNWLAGYWDFKWDAQDVWNWNPWTVNWATLTTDHLGRSNSAYSFDWINDYITAPMSVIWTNDFSYWTWMKTTTTSARVIASSSQVSWDNYFAFINNADWTISFRLVDGTSTNATSTLTYNDDEWHFVVWTRTWSTMKLYVDGVLQDTQTKSANILWTTLYIWNFSSLIAVYFQWEQSLWILQNKIPSADEAKELYNLTSEEYIYPFSKWSTYNLQNGLVMHLDWDGNDLSGNGNTWTSTWTNKVRTNLSSWVEYWWWTDRTLVSYSTDFALNPTTDDYTFSMIMQNDSTSSNTRFSESNTDWDTTDWLFLYADNNLTNIFRFGIYDGTNFPLWSVPLEQWELAHILVVVTAWTDFKIYKNWALWNTTSIASVTSFTNADWIYLWNRQALDRWLTWKNVQKE